MRVLNVTFRYGKEVYGGAEYYLRKLTEEFLKKGHDIDICTTTAHEIKPLLKSGVTWGNELANESVAGAEVLRFSSQNPNKYLSLIFEKLIQNQLDKEESSSMNYLVDTSTNLCRENGGVFLTGWNHPERYGTFEMRWTKKTAKILIKDSNIESVHLSMMNRKGIRATLNVKSEDYESQIQLPQATNWEEVDLKLPSISGIVLLSLDLDRVWRPLKDHRALGIAVAGVKYSTDSREHVLDMDKDYRRLLKIEGQYVDYLHSNAIKRPRFFSIFFDYMRGPNSQRMIDWLDRNAQSYDVILAQMFPFNTIKYALRAKDKGRPVALLPLMHVDDEFYHWRHYYEFLRRADIVLAASEYSKTTLFDKIGANSICVGAGIDRNIFLNDHVRGDRFKEKYGLGYKNIILTVSRKSGSKRYPMLIEAVARVKHDHKDVQLIMIGPDEDRLPVDSEKVLYLGKVSDEDLADAYDACDVFAMMSDSESFGMVFCEAWARKKPVIGNLYCGAVASLIVDGVDGFLCRNVEEIADRIRLLLDNKNLARMMGEKGFKKVMDNYTWDKIGDKVYEICAGLIGDS